MAFVSLLYQALKKGVSGRKTILITDHYWSCISLCGGANGIIYFVKLGDQIRQLPCFCLSILGHGRYHPLMLPKELYAAAETASMMTLRGKKRAVEVT